MRYMYIYNHVIQELVRCCDLGEVPRCLAILGLASWPLLLAPVGVEACKNLCHCKMHMYCIENISQLDR